MKHLSQEEVQEVSGGVEALKPISGIVIPLPGPIPTPPVPPYRWFDPVEAYQP